MKVSYFSRLCLALHSNENYANELNKQPGKNVYWSTFQMTCGVLAISVLDKIFELSKCRLTHSWFGEVFSLAVFFFLLVLKMIFRNIYISET